MKVDKETRFQKQIGNRVRALRNERRMSQEAFADLCSLHRTHMSLLERGEVNITLNTLKTILDALDITASKFFAGID